MASLSELNVVPLVSGVLVAIGWFVDPSMAQETSIAKGGSSGNGYTWKDVANWPDFNGSWSGGGFPGGSPPAGGATGPGSPVSGAGRLGGPGGGPPGGPGAGMALTEAFQEQEMRRVQEVAQGLGSCEPVGVIRHGGNTFFFNRDVIIIGSMENWYNVWRRVYMDGRGHDGDEVEPSYFGHSIGHWEGDTLVIDTVAIRKEAKLTMTTPVGNYDTHLVERIRLLDEDTLEIKRTITNPAVLETPYETARTLTRSDGGNYYEAYCWTDRDEIPGGNLELYR